MTGMRPPGAAHQPVWGSSLFGLNGRCFTYTLVGTLYGEFGIVNHAIGSMGGHKFECT